MTYMQAGRHAARVLALLCGLVGAAAGQDFRIESKVYFVEQEKMTPISENLTLFHLDRVYDFLINPAEITILEPDASGGRLTVLDPARKMQTKLTLKEIDVFLQQLKQAALANDDAFLKFLANPKFDVNVDPQKQILTLNSNWIQYRLTTIDAPNKQVMDRYHQFSNWYAKLNAMANVRALPPFARLVVNSQLNSMGKVPRRVELQIMLQKQMTFRSQHDVDWKLRETDLPRIQEAVQLMQSTPLVDFGTYYDLIPVQAEQVDPNAPLKK